jgi:flagellar biosynthesis protein FliQ
MTFIPKIIGVGIVLLFMMPTMGQMFKDFFVSIMSLVPEINP